VKHNVPFDVALCMEPDERLAWCVFYGQLEGHEYDFDRMRWKEQRP
jgi:hypothetical protein